MLKLRRHNGNFPNTANALSLLLPAVTSQGAPGPYKI